MFPTKTDKEDALLIAELLRFGSFPLLMEILYISILTLVAAIVGIITGFGTSTMMVYCCK